MIFLLPDGLCSSQTPMPRQRSAMGPLPRNCGQECGAVETDRADHILKRDTESSTSDISLSASTSSPSITRIGLVNPGGLGVKPLTPQRTVTYVHCKSRRSTWRKQMEVRDTSVFHCMEKNGLVPASSAKNACMKSDYLADCCAPN